MVLSGANAGNVGSALLFQSRTYQALTAVAQLVRTASTKARSLLVGRRKAAIVTTAGVTVTAALGLAWLWRERQRRRSAQRKQRRLLDENSTKSGAVHGQSRRSRKNLRKNLEYLLRVTVPGLK